MAKAGIGDLINQLKGSGSIHDLTRNLQLLQVQFQVFLFSEGNVATVKREAARRLEELKALEIGKVEQRVVSCTNAIAKLKSFKNPPPEDQANIERDSP